MFQLKCLQHPALVLRNVLSQALAEACHMTVDEYVSALLIVIILLRQVLQFIKEVPLFVAQIVLYTCTHDDQGALRYAGSINKIQPSKALFQQSKCIFNCNSLLRVHFVVLFLPQWESLLIITV